MATSMLTWRVIRSQQDIARRNARQALLVIQQRRREQTESDAALPARQPARVTERRRTAS
jgi:hypothetical protein